VEFRGHHTYFGEMPRRRAPGALINGGRIHFCQPSGLGQQASAGIPGRRGRRESQVTIIAIRAIHPYRHEGLWVFDDETVGLRQEPFVSGADGILDRLTAGIPGAATGFTLLFSAQPFPGFHIECLWQREEFGGNWYHCPAYGADGLLCPAQLKYFETTPPRLYVRTQAKGI